MSDQNELILLKMSVGAIRHRLIAELDAVEAQIDNLLPEEKPRLCVPTGRVARKIFYKKLRVLESE